MTALYKIANEYAQLLAEDLEPEMIADTIEGIEGEFADKVEQLLAVIKNEQYLEDALKAEAKKLTERAKASAARIENIKAYIVSAMLTADKTKLNAGIHSLTVRKPVMSVQIDNAELVPVEFVEFETITKIDKNQIKEQLKLGREIEGVSLVAGKYSLMIK